MIQPWGTSPFVTGNDGAFADTAPHIVPLESLEQSARRLVCAGAGKAYGHEPYYADRYLLPPQRLGSLLIPQELKDNIIGSNSRTQ
jgi:hypothetical protein